MKLGALQPLCVDPDLSQGDCDQGVSNPIAKNCRKLWGNCGKIAENCEKLQSRNQTSQSLKEQHVCTGGSECFYVSSNTVQRYHNCRRRPSISPWDWSMKRRQVDIVIQSVLPLENSATL